jgi:hypothetical protein
MKTAMRFAPLFTVCTALICSIGAFCQMPQSAASPAFQLSMEKLKQNNDKARAADQQAASEDQLAASAQNPWVKMIHVTAAIAYRKQAADARKAASDALAEAERLQSSQPPQSPISTAPAMFISPVGVTGTVPVPVPAHVADTDDYLAISDSPIVERKIEAYLNKSGVKAALLIGGTAHYVRVGYKSANSSVPDFEYRITALNPRTAVETPFQLVAITLFTNYSPSSGNQLTSTLLAAGKTSGCGLYMDDGGSIRCTAWLMVPQKVPIPVEVILDNIRMMNSEWNRLSAQIAALPK